MTLRLRSFLLVLALFVLVGCESKRPPIEDSPTNPAITPSAIGCQRNEPGCACKSEGKRIQCGKVTSTDINGRVTCGTGGQVCSGGKWSECVIDGYAPGHDGIALSTLGSPGGCIDACDLYCKTIADLPDPSVNIGGDGGLGADGGGSSGVGVILGDSGVTLPQVNRSPDGGATSVDLAILDSHMDGGLAEASPDGAIIFHELLPGETAQDPVYLLPGEVPSTDIYFLFDDTSSMDLEAETLVNTLTDSSNGVIRRIRRDVFNDDQNKVQFGLGRFEEYGWRTSYGSGYVTASDTTKNLPYEHMVSITQDETALRSAAKWLLDTDTFPVLSAGPPIVRDIRHSGGTTPESSVTALMMVATGGVDFGSGAVIGAWRSGSPLDCNPPVGGTIFSKYWAPPRKCWPGTAVPIASFATVPTLDVGATTPGSPAGSPAQVPCPAPSGVLPAGYTPGYPCWRPNKTPIVVILTDAPAHNGPGGQYAYTAAPGNLSGSSAYTLQGELNWGVVGASDSLTADTASVPQAAPIAAGADGSSFAAAVNLGALPQNRILYGTVPSRASVSSAGGGLTQTVGDRELVGSWPGTLTTGKTYRNTLRDCQSSQSVNVCVPGGTEKVQTNAASTIAATPTTPTPTFPLLSTVAFIPQTYTSSVTNARSPLPAPTDIGPQTTPTTQCTPMGTNTSNAGVTYSGTTNSAVLTTISSGVGTINYAGPVAMTQGMRMVVSLTFVTVNSGDIRVRPHIRSGSFGGADVVPAPSGWVDSRSSSFSATSTITAFDAVAGATDFYIALEVDPAVVGSGKVNVAYTFMSPACNAGGSYLDVATTTATAAPVCYKCNSGWTFTSSCTSGWLPVTNNGLRGCFNAPAPSCASYGFTACTSSSTSTCSFSGSNPLGGTACGAGRCCTQAPQPPCPATDAGPPVRNIAGINTTQCTYCPAGTTWNSVHGAGGRCYAACGGATPVGPVGGNCYGACPAGYDARTSDRYEVCIQACGGATPNHGSMVSTNPPTCTGTTTYACPASGGPWTLSGGNCTQQSCYCSGAGSPAGCAAAACASNYTCSGAVGAAKCTPTLAVCGGVSCTGTCSATAGPLAVGALNATPAVPASAIPATSVYCKDSCKSTSSCGGASGTPCPGDGGGFGEMIFKFNVPGPAGSTDPADRVYYHFAILRTAQGVASNSDAKAFLYLKAANTTVYNEAGSDGNPNGKVLDCNRDATLFYLKDPSTDANRYVRSEINAFLYPGDYYLVVDKWGANGVTAPALPAAYNYILEMGAFAESKATQNPLSPMTSTFIGNPFTAPSFAQTAKALKEANVKVVGVESSGVSCGQASLASTNISQYETRDWLEALGRATASVRGRDDVAPGTGKKGDPFVNSIRNDARDCNNPSGTTGLADAIVQNISDLTATLREDITLRAHEPVQGVSAPVYTPSQLHTLYNAAVPATITADSFIQDVKALDSSDVQLNCGSISPPLPAIGADSGVAYSSQKFNLCIPGTGVVFQVTFVIPASLPRGSDDIYIRFDLSILKGIGEIGRTPVILKLPKLPVAGDFWRDYDLTNVCPEGTRIHYDRVAWDTDDPLPSATNATGSKIELFGVMGSSMAALVTTPEKPLLFDTGPSRTCTANAVVARASPAPDTQVGSGRIDCAFGLQRDNFFRVHFKLSPSPAGAYPGNAVYVPTLKSWNLYVSCPPSE